MGRYRWITIVDVKRVPEAYLIELVEWSYQKALNALSKKRRNTLLNLNPSHDSSTRSP